MGNGMRVKGRALRLRARLIQYMMAQKEDRLGPIVQAGLAGRTGGTSPPQAPPRAQSAGDRN